MFLLDKYLPMSEEQKYYVFNQYYIDFMKKVKALSKEHKDTKPEARSVLRAIKKHFSTMDKLTPDYTNSLNACGFWDCYDNPSSYSDEFLNKPLYTDILVKDIIAISTDPYLVYYYICLLDIFRTDDLPTDQVLDVIKCLNGQEDIEEKIKSIENEVARNKLHTLKSMQDAHSRNTLEDEIKGIENTSLGKLAKEIMADIDVDSLHKSMNDPNMNIFESLQNPNSGFGKVLGSVSKTMLSKLSSGELQKDVLLKDAVDLASKIPKMLPNGMGSQLGNIGEMLETLQKLDPSSASRAGGGGGEPNPADMMEALMGMMNLNGKQRKKATSKMTEEMNKNRNSAASRLKRKLDKKRKDKDKEKDKNNIRKDIVEDTSNE